MKPPDIGAVSVFLNPFLSYPNTAPFHPDTEFPEYPFRGLGLVDAGNRVYRAVRETLRLLGLDAAHFGSSDWNPLRGIVRPGDRVVIKPNAVFHRNMDPNQTVFASITHGSVLRAVMDYTFKALSGSGQIVIADAPLNSADFEQWERVTQIDEVASFYRDKVGFEVQIVDLRRSVVSWDSRHDFAPSSERVRLAGDPEGYVTVDLGAKSAFTNLGAREIQRLYGADYDRPVTVAHHSRGRHEYLVAGTVLKADAFISVPKLKTHQKVGVTINIKGMVGTQGDKNYIPHCRIGPPSRGGDEYPNLGLMQDILNRYRMWLLTAVLGRKTSLADVVYRRLRPLLRAGQSGIDWFNGMRYTDHMGNVLGGAWYGNDTAWRMALDLTRSALYSDRTGQLQDTLQRRFFSVVDGIIGGEGEGPLAPRARACGALISGISPLAIDAVGARLMGFDPLKIPMIARGMEKPWLNLWGGTLADIRINSNFEECGSIMRNREDPLFGLGPPKGWQGHIEMAKRAYSPIHSRWIESRESFSP
jgi:uncharacterized protein (DUF362 family)